MDIKSSVLKIGEEHMFFQLIAAYEEVDSLPSECFISNIKAFIKGRCHLSVLDVGYEKAQSLMCLYHGLELAKHSHGTTMVGIDSEGYTISDSWRMYQENFKPSEDDRMLSKSEFQNTFKLWPNKSLEDYFSGCDTSQGPRAFDMIIASNVLHFVESKDILVDVLKRMKLCLKQDGKIYIRIKEKPGAEKAEAFISIDEFEEVLSSVFSGPISLLRYDFPEFRRLEKLKKAEDEGMEATFTNFEE